MTVQKWIWTIVGCLVLLVILYVLLDHFAPYTSDAYLQAYVVQVAPQVDGRVTQVPVTDNAYVEEGDLLFALDDRPYRYRVEQLEAQLVQTISDVKQIELQLLGAEEAVKAAAAETDYAKQVYEMLDELYKEQAATFREWVEATDNYHSLQAQLAQRQTEEGVARLAADAVIDDMHVLIREVEANLKLARYELEQTRVYAPSDGYVTNLQLRQGAYASAGDQVMTFVDTTSWWVVANYMENSLTRMEPGQEAELSIAMTPGRVLKGQVESISWGVWEGQGVPSGDLPYVPEPENWVRMPQRLPVRLTFDPQDHTGPLRVGASVSVTVYTSPDNPINLISMVWHRISSWLDYLY